MASGFYYAVSAMLCLAPGMGDHLGSVPWAVIQPSSASTVVPLPEADEQYSSPTPVDTVVVDKDGNMQETQYTYDPGQGGVVINNYYNVGGPGCSLYFPAFGVGFLWWNGYWCDYNGYYWNGFGFVLVNYPGWRGHWDGYWHGGWSHKWDSYRRQHPNGGRGRARGGNFEHRGGMGKIPSHPPRGGGGGHGGGGHGGGHGGGGHGGGGGKH